MSISKKPVAFFVALVLFAAVNLFVLTISQVYQPDIKQSVFSYSETDSHVKPWTWWLARKWLEQDKAPDVVLFGSSQMGSAIVASDAKHLLEVVDALTHRRVVTLESELAARMPREVSVFSLASPGAMCSDAFMASSALFRQDFKPKVVVIGISPRDFMDNTMPYPAATEPFKFYSHYVNPGDLTSQCYNGPMAWLQFAASGLPCKKLGEHLQARLASSTANDAPANQTSPLAAVLGAGEAVPGKWLVPARMPPMWIDNTKEYKRRFKSPNPPVYAAEKAFFNRFLAKMESDGIQVLVVGMPSMTVNRELLPESFWSEFRATVGTMCHLHNAQWLDLTADPRFVKSDYLDTVHLNAFGGKKLFVAIASYMKQDAGICLELSAPNQPKVRTASNVRTSTH